MARDLEDCFERLGFDVEIVSSNDHAWISINGIEFDSVTLLPYFFVSGFHDGENISYYPDYNSFLTNST